MSTALLAAAVGLPLVGALVAAVLRSPQRSGRLATSALGLASIASIVVLAVAAAAEDGLAGDGLLRANRATALLLLVVTGTATVVSSFSTRSLDRDERTPWFFAATAVLVAGSALVLTATGLVLVGAGWIVSGWALAALVGFDRNGPRMPAARRRIVRSIAVGDVALVLALVAAARASDGLSIDALAATGPLAGAGIAGLPAVDVVAVLLVVAGLSRSAIFPFHRWLAGTLVAPTPVSAIVHAGFVSGAGILLLRFADPFVASPTAVVLAFAAAGLTVVLASSASASRPDVKGSLAWSTVAQMAFMVVQCAVGAFSSAVFHIAGHGMYKAARFLGAGDTVPAAVRERRRPAGADAAPPPIRWAVVALAPAIGVALGAWWLPPHVNDAGQVLIVAFAWATGAAGLAAWTGRRPFGPLPTLAIGGVLAVLAGLAYFGGLYVVEGFLEPVVASPVTAIDTVPLVVVLALGALGLAALAVPGAAPFRTAAASLRIRWSEGTLRTATAPSGDEPAVPTTVDESERSRIRGDVARAASLVAPMWPLSSFVAVNPLGGLEAQGFDGATATARRWLGARTHLSLAEFRADHDRRLTRLADLEYVVHRRYAELCAHQPTDVEGRLVSPADIVVTDLLHGPELADGPVARTSLERLGAHDLAELVDRIVAGWAADYVTHPEPGERFVTRCRRLAASDPRLRAALTAPAHDWLTRLDPDPAAMLGAAFVAAGVEPDGRVDELRGRFARLPGWSGLAKWRNEWAIPGDPRPPLAPIEIAAVHAALDAAVVLSLPEPVPAVEPADDTASRPDALDARVRAVADVLAPGGKQRDLDAIRAVLDQVPHTDRAPMWLEAQERCFDERLLAVLDRVDPGRRVERPDAQAVFCIDVRSEGFRRHLEDAGEIETFGFAGFFGVPLSIRRIGWTHDEARCPVLVAPSIPASELPHADAIGALGTHLAAERWHAGVHAAHAGAKKAPGAAFALAEATGWVSGPTAAARTLLPLRATPPAPRRTRMLLEESVLVEQRIFAAESVLRTMGLIDRFAPVVLLCGHTSRTVNNAHASALDCGACAGAAGDDNALAVAALLNAPDVRHGLAERGIEIPDDTWFVAGLHDTASDHVTILDAATVPETHVEQVTRLQSQLDRAGAAQAAARSAHLPGSPGKVRHRGADWAQVRPEWGLARAAAFVIGPRSFTSGIDLDGRAFLHGYDAEHDPTGRVLETIMTAPLVVAHWITSQYYFSTVDPEVFGAGDKLMHNPIGSIGVVSGDGGDLRVGLPLQSTHVDGERHHQPVRLLAVIQADLARIEEIIGRHRILQTLVGGSWLRIAARSHPHEPWSTRTAEGTWITNPRPFDTATTIADESFHLVNSEMS